MIRKANFDIGRVRNNKLHHALTYHEMYNSKLHMIGDFIHNPCIMHIDAVSLAILMSI